MDGQRIAARLTEHRMEPQEAMETAQISQDTGLVY